MDKKITQKFLNFLDSGINSFFVTEELKKTLLKKKAQELFPQSKWKKLLSGIYFTIFEDNLIIAFKIPKSIKQKKFSIGATHSDSPCLKLKPFWSQKSSFILWSVESYGGLITSSWFNRDLSLAGQVNFLDKQDSIQKQLLKIEDKKFCIPHLAVHLAKNKYKEINKHKELNPIIGLEDKTKTNINEFLTSYLKPHCKKILSYELFLYDNQKASLGGLNNEFIYSSRLDNLAMTYSNFQGLISSNEPRGISIALCTNHEEVGSYSDTGAHSNFIKNTLERIALNLNWTRDEFLQALSSSLIVSADMAHGVHPNYSEFHDEELHTKFGEGLVIKLNANQKYTSNTNNIAKIIAFCEKYKIKYQKFINRGDIPCSSTIAPILSSKLGISTIDLGNPMLSMHSIREVTAKSDQENSQKFFKQFFEKQS